MNREDELQGIIDFQKVELKTKDEEIKKLARKVEVLKDALGSVGAERNKLEEELKSIQNWRR